MDVVTTSMKLGWRCWLEGDMNVRRKRALVKGSLRGDLMMVPDTVYVQMFKHFLEINGWGG